MKMLAADRVLSKKYGLKTMTNINGWFEQRDDNAFRRVSLDTIELLERHYG